MSIYGKFLQSFFALGMISARRMVLLGMILLLNYFSNGQDIQFSQFYANVLYQNPAFTGSAHGLRGIAHQRLQWPNLDARYITSMISVDNYFSGSRSGIGLMYLKDWQGASHITSSELSLQYAQEISLSSRYFIRAGAQGTFASRNLDYAKLTFPDQFNDDGFNDPVTGEPFGANNTEYFDCALGGLLYSDNLWIGISSHHINTPEQSFYDDESDLPHKLAVSAGYKFRMKGRQFRNEDGEVSITPTMHYKLQGKSDQLDLGLYGAYDQLILGIWYRGIPLLKHYREGLQNNEAVIFLAGWKITSNLSLAYSYDFTVSKLVPAKTGGSHELNITYVYNKPPKKKKPMKKLPCPKF